MDKILVIDDMISNTEMIKNTLGREYEILCLNDTEDIWKTCFEFNPDLILLDIIMPVKNGFELCLDIRKQSDFAEIPIIFITSRDEVADVLKGFKCGGQDYITRPFYTEELIARIKTHMELKKSKESLRAYAKKLEEKNRELIEMSKIDFVTGIANRRYMIGRINEEISRVSRNNKVFSIMLCDMDNFKKINDTFGHETGDYVVKEAARIISNNTRKEDIAARWGGEEFLVMLPDTNKMAAKETAERIRKAVEAYDGEFKGSRVKLTVTIGISEYSQEISIEECISNADDAMYEGKRNGRNRIIVY